MSVIVNPIGDKTKVSNLWDHRLITASSYKKPFIKIAEVFLKNFWIQIMSCSDLPKSKIPEKQKKKK